MFHYYVAPATKEVVMYLVNGGREFFTKKEINGDGLTVRFLASPEYVAKMSARPFLKNIEIKIKT